MFRRIQQSSNLLQLASCEHAETVVAALVSTFWALNCFCCWAYFCSKNSSALFLFALLGGEYTNSLPLMQQSSVGTRGNGVVPGTGWPRSEECGISWTSAKSLHAGTRPSQRIIKSWNHSKTHH